MRRHHAAWLAAATALACGAGVAEARVTIEPVTNVRQITDLGLDDDSLTTYTEASVGLNMRVETRRINGTVNYSFARRFAQQGDIASGNRHSLVARTRVEVVDRALIVETGAFASMLNRDLGRSSASSEDSNDSDLVQSYSVYVEPRIHQNISELAEFDLTYRVGYSAVDDRKSLSTGSIGANDTTPRTPVADSVNQKLTAKLGNRQQSARFRWDIIGEVTYEDIDRLEQNYRAYSGSAEAEWRISRKFGVIANIGYEDISNDELAFVTDASGRPQAGPDGGFIPDPAAPRNILFDQQGLTYEAGFVWTPSQRAFLSVRGGKRFGDRSISVQGRYRQSDRLGFTLGYSETIESFGRLLTQDIAGTSTSFVVPSTGFLGANGCIIGEDPTTGNCIGNATQSLSNAQFRSQSGQFIVAGAKGGTRYSATVQGSRRKLLGNTSRQAPGELPVDPALLARADTSLSITLNLGQRLGNSGTMGLALFANRYSFAVTQGRQDYQFGGSTSYSLRLGKQISMNAAATLSRRLSDGNDSTYDGTVSLGASIRY